LKRRKISTWLGYIGYRRGEQWVGSRGVLFGATMDEKGEKQILAKGKPTTLLYYKYITKCFRLLYTLSSYSYQVLITKEDCGNFNYLYFDEGFGFSYVARKW
jgi:hypothetical protein